MKKAGLEFRQARKTDCRHIAQLALIAGEGFPAYFWSQSAKDGEDILEVGTRNAGSNTENFSYRNTIVVIDNLAEDNGNIVAMLLAYPLPDRLPEAENAENLADLPELIQPLVELERCVPGTFYINMIATLPGNRGMGIGSQLLDIANDLARDQGYDMLSIQVFEQNKDALRLYQKHGFEIIDSRPVVPHECHPYNTNVLLLTRPVHLENKPIQNQPIQNVR